MEASVMIALLLAAQLSAEIVRGMPAERVASGARAPTAAAAADQLPTPNVYKQPARCKDAAVKVVDRYGRPVTQKLGELPPGALQYAVDRSIDGCRVITVITGTVLPDQSGPTQGQMIPLIRTPAVHEGAPSNRR
jgi:hypothetical protein